jgi:hydroxymethylpyrimidine pyrophosphatase-like HAD family hydrolase
VAAGDPVNAFLAGAGMQQAAEDHLHGDPFLPDRIARRLRRRVPGPWGRVAGAVPHAAGSLLWRQRAWSPGRRAGRAWLGDLDRLVQRLATAVGDPGELDRGLRSEVDALLAELPRLPVSMRRRLLRLPSCFRSFDQSPEDLEALAAAFAARWPELARPVVVAGVRTSGSYLAPLVAAALRRLGYADVTAVALRPGQRWLPGESRPVERAAAGGGLALLVDDPPRTWASVGGGARALAGLGFGARRTVLLLATFADAARPPAALAEHPAVLLPFACWTALRRLEPGPTRLSLARLLAGRAAVGQVRRLGDGPQGTGRTHVEAVFEVEIDAGTGWCRRLVRARGVGLGYLGDHALAVAARLPDRVPEVYGIDGGILYESWTPPGRALREPLTESEAAEVAGYAADRGRALPLAGDPSPRLGFRGTASDWAGIALGGVLGRAPEAGEILAAAVARRLLRVPAPAVIDNRTELGAFARLGGAAGLVKARFDTGVFGSDDYLCFDPLSDVALAATSASEPATGDRLRRAYEAAAGVPVDPERWLLYQLAHVLVSWERMRPEARCTDPRPARLLRRYYAEVLLGGLRPPEAGPLCAIDLDGVLETTPLRFPATTPAGALALRALSRHGYRAVLATGRSLADVRDRCAVYGLAGGVAEYGSALYVHGRRDVEVLLEPAARAAVGRVREALAEAGDAHLDPAYECSVRAFRLDGRGDPAGLPAERVAEVIAASRTRDLVRAVAGHHQTDIVAAGVSKERALLRLAHELGAHDEPPLALAVGDTVSDVGMLGIARLAAGPGNADRAVRSVPGVVVARRPAQAGLAQAVARLLGHPPGRCPVCAPPPLSSSSRLLLDLLALGDLRPWRRLPAAARLALECRDG